MAEAPAAKSGAAGQQGPGLVATLLVILLWYAINIGVVIFNKIVLSSQKFEYPIFLSLCHMSACSLIGFLTQSVLGWFPAKPISSRKQLVNVCLLSVIFCATIVLGNWSLKYIPGR